MEMLGTGTNVFAEKRFYRRDFEGRVDVDITAKFYRDDRLVPKGLKHIRLHRFRPGFKNKK